MAREESHRAVLGLRPNLGQFSLLVLVNAFVGAMVGLERTVLPLLAKDEFGLASSTAALSFLISFGLVKAATNLLAGRLADLWGRKVILLVGWLLALPVPLLIIWAPNWWWVVGANALLGVNQGLCWSTTIIMKVDLVGPRRRGLATGLNEFAGYGAVALAALATGYLASAYALRPQPFFLGMALALAGLLTSLLLVRETRGHAQLEANAWAGSRAKAPSWRQVFTLTSWRDHSLFSASQAGFVNNLNDGVAWGLFPLFFAAAGLATDRIGVIAAVYPATWGAMQVVSGPLSDRLGRKGLIAVGMWVQAAALGLIVLLEGFAAWVGAAAVLGLGTAMVYPTLLAAIGDRANPQWRASAIGVYRMWRDSGFAVGGLGAGLLADAFNLDWAIGAVALLTLASGLVVAVRMEETLPGARPAGSKVEALRRSRAAHPLGPR